MGAAQGTVTAGIVTDLLASDLYLNVHSQLFRAGEIRGQLIAVPEPSTHAPAASAVLGLFIYRRRQERSTGVDCRDIAENMPGR